MNDGERSNRSRWTDDRLDDRFREYDNFRLAVSRLPDSVARIATQIEGLADGRADNRAYIGDVERRLAKRLDEVADTCRAMDRKWDEREEAREQREANEEQAARQRRVMVAIACGTGLLTIIVTIGAALLGLIGHG